MAGSSRRTARGSFTTRWKSSAGKVLIAEAQKVKVLAPLACKPDKSDARVLVGRPSLTIGSYPTNAT